MTIKNPKDGEWWMVSDEAGDVRVMRYWLRDGNDDAVWNIYKDESISVLPVSLVTPMFKMDKVECKSLGSKVAGQPKPRTKAEFVKCEFNHAWEAVKTFEDGEELYTKRSHKDFVLIDNAPDVLRFLYDLHRKVETEIDERQEFIDECQKYGSWEAMHDSGKFKLVEK